MVKEVLWVTQPPNLNNSNQEIKNYFLEMHEQHCNVVNCWHIDTAKIVSYM